VSRSPSFLGQILQLYPGGLPALDLHTAEEQLPVVLGSIVSGTPMRGVKYVWHNAVSHPNCFTQNHLAFQWGFDRRQIPMTDIMGSEFVSHPPHKTLRLISLQAWSHRFQELSPGRTIQNIPGSSVRLLLHTAKMLIL
jgi:hypothetical protein